MNGIDATLMIIGMFLIFGAVELFTYRKPKPDQSLQQVLKSAGKLAERRKS